MQRDYVYEKSPYFLHVDIQKEISSYGVEQKMNDYIGLQKTSSKNKFWLHIIDITEKNSQLLSPSELGLQRD